MIFREGTNEKRRKTHSIPILNLADGRKIQSLSWFICGLGDGEQVGWFSCTMLNTFSDTTYRVRLFVAQRNGERRVYTFARNASRTWTATEPVVHTDTLHIRRNITQRIVCPIETSIEATGCT